MWRRAIASLMWMASIVAFVAGFAGCGSHGRTLWPVSGKVTFQGKPVSAGTIRFNNPKAAIDMTATIHADGSYEVIMARGVGLPEGTYEVAVMPPVLAVPLGPTPDLPKPTEWPNIPGKYRIPSTSGLALTVKASDNRFNVDMQP